MTVKVLLDSSVTGMFDKRTAEKHSFKLQKLEKPLIVKNVDSARNNKGSIIH